MSTKNIPNLGLEIDYAAQELRIPDYLDAEEVKEVLEDAVILEQFDNGHNFCVLAVWKGDLYINESMVYFSRFFKVGDNTGVSHDAMGTTLLQGLIKVARLANKYFE